MLPATFLPHCASCCCVAPTDRSSTTAWRCTALHHACVRLASSLVRCGSTTPASTLPWTQAATRCLPAPTCRQQPTSWWRSTCCWPTCGWRPSLPGPSPSTHCSGEPTWGPAQNTADRITLAQGDIEYQQHDRKPRARTRNKGVQYAFATRYHKSARSVMP